MPTVVFVCEHGAAKSVIAAAHLNRLARERHLNVRAIGRGTNPEAMIATNVITGLETDGLTPENAKPERLSPSDLESATRIVAFCEIPNGLDVRVPMVRWTDVPPVSEGYWSRGVIVQRVAEMLDEMTRGGEV